MNETLLALMSFGLGIVATLLYLFINRQLAYSDAKRKKRLEYLQQVKQWFDTWRALFDCDFPHVSGFFNGYNVRKESGLYDPVSAKYLYEEMRKYKEVKDHYDIAERIGYDALDELRDKSILYKYPLILLRRDLSSLPPGLPRKLEPYIKELRNLTYQKCVNYPELVANFINWGKLNLIEPENIATIIGWRLDISESNTERHEEVADYYSNLPGSTRANFINMYAEKIIREYEKKWITP